VKHIKDVLHEMYDDDSWDIDKQAKYLETYKIDAIKLGRMCEKFPGLQKSWEQFIIMYELCRSEDDSSRQDS
jgi:hypothetical protein